VCTTQAHESSPLLLQQHKCTHSSRKLPDDVHMAACQLRVYPTLSCLWPVSCTLQTESSEHPDTKIVTLRGSPDNVAKAKDSIKQLLEEALAPQEGETEEKIPCPAGIVGRIIGRGGETIRWV